METPWAGVNCTVQELRARLVANPVTAIVAVLVVCPAVGAAEVATTVNSVGAAAATVNCAVVAGAGVRSTFPARVAKVGVIVTVFATVPVCKPILGPRFPNTALVLLAAITNGTDVPPLANCTAGSGGRFPDELRTSVPEIATG